MKLAILFISIFVTSIALSGQEILFNVMDYGATGNGTSDDTAAIQATIAAASPYGTVYFPNGAYKTTATLVLGTGLATNSISIRGQSREGTLIRYTPATASGVAIKFNINQHATFKDFSLTNYAGSQGTTEGIQFSGSPNAGTLNYGNYFNNIGIANFYYDIHLDDGTGTTGSENTFQNVDVYGATAGVYSHNPNAYSTAFINCGANSCTRGFDIEGGTHYFYGGHTSSNVTDFYVVQTQTFYISNVYSEGASTGLYLRTNHSFVSNCTISGTPATAIEILSGDITIAGCRLAGPIRVWNGSLRVNLVSTGVYANAPILVSLNYPDTYFSYSFTNVQMLRADLTPILAVPNKTGLISSSYFKDLTYPPRRVGFSNVDYVIPTPIITSSPVTMVSQTGIMTAVRNAFLPPASSFAEGTGFDVVDESGSVNSTYVINCIPTGADKINGATLYPVAEPYKSVKFISNGVNKWLAK